MKKVIILIVLTLTTIYCSNRTEDVPLQQLTFAKSDIVGEWLFTKIQYNGNWENFSSENMKTTFYNDDTFETTNPKNYILGNGFFTMSNDGIVKCKSVSNNLSYFEVRLQNDKKNGIVINYRNTAGGFVQYEKYQITKTN